MFESFLQHAGRMGLVVGLTIRGFIMASRCISLACAVTIAITSAATAQTTGFIFSGDHAFAAADQWQYIRVGEKLSIPQLQQRFPGHTISKTGGHCGGVCIVVKAKDGEFLRLDYDPTFFSIYSSAPNSRDILGNTIGTSLSKAVGANPAKCDHGQWTTCESAKIEGLSYFAGGCDFNGNQIPDCATVYGFAISRHLRGW
jgi:hypothetical protein